jgi:hypothetical protein
MVKIRHPLIVAAGLMIWPLGGLVADQVTMLNGDVYNGTVLAMSTNNLVLNNENLGVVNVPRTKVAAIHFGASAAAGASPARPWAATAAGIPVAPTANRNDADLSAALRGLRDQTNLLQQVQSQVMGSAASPEADAKFNELLAGLSTGKIDVNDLRAQASDAAAQIKELKKELGPNDSGEMDSYLTILNNFLQETAPGNGDANRNQTPPAQTPPP